MTSSVFGGIAARTTNSEAVVSLDERIAVGDPQCRVTITFGDAVRPATWGHRYRPRGSQMSTVWRRERDATTGGSVTGSRVGSP